MYPKKFNRSPVVVRLPRRQPIALRYMLVASGESFGPFKTEAQAAMFAAIRWPKEVPAWHIEKHGYER
jgi:hypothetical protein